MFQRKQRLSVIELGTDVTIHDVEIEANALRGIKASKGHAWLNPGGVLPRYFDGGRVYLAQGGQLLNWPREDANFDRSDDGQQIRITSAHIDAAVEAADTEAMMRGAQGRNWIDIILGGFAGVGIGTLLALGLVKLLKIGVLVATDPAQAPQAIVNATAATFGGA